MLGGTDIVPTTTLYPARGRGRGRLLTTEDSICNFIEDQELCMISEHARQ
jgi:hypothetical protein